jgi:hypothetical protein
MRMYLTNLLLVLVSGALKSVALHEAEKEPIVSLSTSNEGESEVHSIITDPIPPTSPSLSSPISSTTTGKGHEKMTDHGLTPRVVKMHLSKGKEYYGSVVGKDMHGKGVLQYADGTKYEGEFVYNKRHGRGRIRYASGEEYRGGWINGFMTGRGTYTFQDGGVYEVSMHA